MNQQPPKEVMDKIKAYEDRQRAWGLNPNFAQEALEKAEERGDDFNPIHGLIG